MVRTNTLGGRRWLAAVGGVAATAALLMTGAAEAAGTGEAAAAEPYCAHLGANWGCASANRLQASAHDEECNNTSVYAEYWAGGGIHGTVYDTNGCAAGGGYRNVPRAIYSFQICEEPGYCSPTRMAPLPE